MKKTCHAKMRSTIKTLLFIVFVFLLSQGECRAGEDPPFVLPKKRELSKIRSAILFTDVGEVHFELYPEDAPWHVANLKYLADKHFYRNLKFHIYEPGYIIQGGDPTGRGNGNPGYSLPSEFNSHAHEEGTLGMARMRGEFNPERRSNGSQFYITLGRAPHMDGLYTAFGKVTKGIEVLRQLRQGDKIKDLVVYVRK